jgi:hypothetical protein
MKGRIFAGLFLVFVLVVGAIGLSAVAFNMGVSQGIAQGAQVMQVPAAEAGNAVRMYSGPYFYPRPFGFGFGLGGILIAGLVLFLIFGLVRRIIWGGAMVGPWAFRRGFGHWGANGAAGVPPMVEEWHKRMHAQEAGKTEPTSNPQV